MLGQVSALFSCLRSVVDAPLPMRTVWEIDQAFRVHLLRHENNDRKTAFGKLQKRMEIHGKLARWIRAYIFASFCACKRKADEMHSLPVL